MAITEEQFEALVGKLESFSKKHPGSYRLRVALFAILGYAYIFLVLVGLLALVGLIVLSMFLSHSINPYIIKLGILSLIPAWIIARSLWVTFSPPQDLKLSRRQVPQLFALVDELTRELQTPQFHNILLIQEFNAAVARIPRLGIFGWQENYLLLGLPLMQSLSLEQFKAVLSRELGHLSGNHSRFGRWIYRIRETWMQLYERLHQRSKQHSVLFNRSSEWYWPAFNAYSFVLGLFNRFLEWYWPAFNAYSFVLARMNEYEADRCSAQLAGTHNAAEALINTKIKARFLESCFWSNVYQQVEHQAEPPNNVYSSMLTILHSPIAEEQSNQWLEQALTEKTDCADTHPCLTDRLKSLGYLDCSAQALPQPATIQISAAEHLLGDTLHQLVAQLDQDWQVAASTPWRQRYAYLQETKDKLQALEQKAQMQALHEQEAWERAYYTLELQGDESALPLLQEVLTIQPDHAEANYTLGQVLLGKADAAGVIYIEKAMARRIDLVIDGCNLLYRFFSQQGQTEPAQKYHERAQQHYQVLLKDEQERDSVSDQDQFKSHTLQASEVNELKQHLATHPQVKEAYLVEKVVTYFPERRFCVLGIVRKRSWLRNEHEAQKLINLLVTNLQFPTEAYIIILNHSSSGKLKKKIDKIDRSLIFRR